MSSLPPTRDLSESLRSDRFHLWRSRKDRVVRWLIATGGIGAIVAVMLIFFYLLWVVFPLFMPAGSSLGEPTAVSRWNQSEPVYLSLEEQREVGIRISDSGLVEFFHLSDAELLSETRLPLAPGASLVRAIETNEQTGRVALASSDGQVFVRGFKHIFCFGKRAE